MGFFDAIASYSPMAQGASIARTLIIAAVVLMLFVIIWFTFLAKSSMSGAPPAVNRLFGVITTPLLPKKHH